VPEDKGREFVTELAAAGREFEAAWDLDPAQPKVAVGRMSVAGPLGDFEDLEDWFRKAMTADGDCHEAVGVKANFLQRKWGGHNEAVRQFADRLVATRNWHAMLPFHGVDMLRTVTTHGLVQRVADRDWPAVEAAFDAFFKERPASRWGWSLYAKVASQPARHAAVVRAAEHIGGRPSRTVFFPGEFEALLTAAKADGNRPK
jgi:hypothetical protein